MIGAPSRHPAICVLGSGSRGNCTAISIGWDGTQRPRVLLVDLGLSPRATRRRLAEVGASWSAVTDVLLTHLDSDHFAAAWLPVLEHCSLRLFAAETHCRALRAAGVRSGLLQPLPLAEAGTATAALGPSTLLTAAALPHDEGSSTGWLIDDGGLRIGYATDLGQVPTTLFEAFSDLDAICFESNYDRTMQLASARPPLLKRRIMGGRGHLSNEQALAAILRMTGASPAAAEADEPDDGDCLWSAPDRRSGPDGAAGAMDASPARPSSDPAAPTAHHAAMPTQPPPATSLQHIVLLHLSRQCNDPERIRRLWRARAPHLADRLVLSSQDSATGVLRLRPRA